jgi:hypothetical protein
MNPTPLLTIPASGRQWTASNATDIAGAFVAAKNVDLDKAGYLQLAKRAMVWYSKNENTAFLNPIATASDGLLLYVLTEGGMFTFDVATGFLVNRISVSGPNFGVYGDLDMFLGLPHVSDATHLYSYNGSTFTSRATDLSSSYPHPMCRNSGSNKLAIADGNVLRQYDSSYVRDTTNELTISSDYVITRVLYRNGNYYILTRNIAGGHARLFVWNGAGVGNNGEYPISGDWIYSGCLYGSSIAVITSLGQVLSFNGGGFDPLDNLPIYYTPWAWTSQAATNSLVGNVASRGMDADGDTLLININGQVNGGQGGPSGTYLQNMPSGLWTYEKNTGLYHRAGVNYKTFTTASPASVASNRLVFSAAHGLKTGDPVLCATLSGISGVNQGQTYYAIVDQSKTILLALSPAQAKVGVNIAISGTPVAGDTFSFDNVESQGSGEVSDTGCVYVFKKLTPNSFYGTSCLFGGVSIDNSNTSIPVLMSLGMGRNEGYFITPKIASPNITETFQKLFVKFPQLNLDSESITVKYRVAERFGVPDHTDFSGIATFTSATTFTIDPAVKDVDTLQVGDEVEFVQGAASGYTAHLTAIDKSAVPYTLTVDTTLPVSNGDKTDFIASNWAKLADLTNASEDNSQNFANVPTEDGGTWVQYKIVLRGLGNSVAIEQLILTNQPKQQPT